MKKMKAFSISFSGLKIGEHHFEYDIDNTFFTDLDYSEFNKADLKVDLNFNKKTTLMELSFKTSGTVNVNCDLTNEPFDQKVEGSINVIVKFGDEFNDDNEEILILPHNEFELNVAQFIYEMIILAIPLKKTHPGIEDGTLKSEILDVLEELSPNKKENNNNDDYQDTRWDS